MTTCANCRTAVGRFTRVERLGPLCVPTDPAIMREHYVGLKDPQIAACNGRRTILDEHNLGRHGKPNRACPVCMAVPA